jgi:hopanoid biosynthesis associated protein HpnK
MVKTVVINADDFGLCEGVNKGIVKAHTEGVLTSATIMANMPTASEAVEIAKNLPSLGVGVHLNITDGKPLSKEPCVKYLLDSQGEFRRSAGKLALISIVSSTTRKAIEAEFSAQIQWAINNGIQPTHLDSHKHIHSFPVIFSIVCRLAKQFKIRAIRFTFEPKQLCRQPWPMTTEENRKNAGTIRMMAKINKLQNRSFFKTEALLGIAHTGKIDFSFLKAVVLYNPVQISEVMTHPGFLQGLDPTKTRLIQQRKTELDALCSEKVKQFFKDAGIKLVHYGQL